MVRLTGGRSKPRHNNYEAETTTSQCEFSRPRYVHKSACSLRQRATSPRRGSGAEGHECTAICSLPRLHTGAFDALRVCVAQTDECAANNNAHSHSARCSERRRAFNNAVTRAAPGRCRLERGRSPPAIRTTARAPDRLSAWRVRGGVTVDQ
ncbi:hypothetical protein EVAR_32188_1 [Eumeta japonica]|uniref:Uncharacterized protein n=1 Tax=Eumeta variegata TaxID=151549 RepID=A0A4C1VZ79_EUMVA|nr:hypothetical protein EVAR_32188_1 [Eumeta japonica]